MSDKENNKSQDDIGNSDGVCVVCTKDCKIYSIGECDHFICFECSTRMRVLCQQNSCAICRNALPKVIFTTEKKSYRELKSNSMGLYHKQYKICFASLEIQKKFYKLLEHSCLECNSETFASFNLLSEHMRRVHEFHYCDICTENLQVFSSERKYYTRQELATHRRKGDLDNKSYRGHPLCEHCDIRYFDKDELFAHLRRDHFYCFICERNEKNEFYVDYNTLRQHYRFNHFLCEEGDCAFENFTSVFSNEIDYKAHVANKHSQALDKMQAKQARTLQLDMTVGARGRPTHNEQSTLNSIRATRNTENDYSFDRRGLRNVRPSACTIDSSNEQEFPSLGIPENTQPVLRSTISNYKRPYNSSSFSKTNENFPALESSNPISGTSTTKTDNSQLPSSAVLKRNINPLKSGINSIIHTSNRKKSAYSNNNTQTNKKLASKDEFPALPNAKNSSGFREDNTDITFTNGNILSAKHKLLVNDYVSVAQPTSKINIFKPEEVSKNMKSIKKSELPKLNNNDFPALATPTTMNISISKPLKNDTNLKKSKSLTTIQKNTNKYETSVNTDESLLAKKVKNLKVYSMQSEGKEGNQTKTISLSNRDKPIAPKKIKDINNLLKTKENLSPLNVLEMENCNNKSVGAKIGKKLKPPPGFKNVTIDSVAKPDNLKCKSSLNESFKIVPSHQYIPPKDAVIRNKKLTEYVRSSLNSVNAFEEFKYLSQNFRQGTYKSEPYYELCKAVLKNNFDKYFPELIVLLPDIVKQQELYLVHSRNIESKHNHFKVCSECQQVLLESDMNNHSVSHNLESSFPSLVSTTR